MHMRCAPAEAWSTPPFLMLRMKRREENIPDSAMRFLFSQAQGTLVAITDTVTVTVSAFRSLDIK